MDLRLVFVTVGILGLYLFQERFIYVPSAKEMGIEQNPDNNRENYRNPGERGLTYEDVYVTSLNNVKIHGWLITHQDSASLPTIIFFHTNAGNIGLPLDFIESLHKKLNVNILIFGYRGYSKSEGVPKEEGIVKDAEAILKYALQSSLVDNNQIFLYGLSLGGAVAIDLASKYNHYIQGVILENPFANISLLVDEMFPHLKSLKSFLLRLKWDSLSKIVEITRPILFIRSEYDDLIPNHHTLLLNDKASNTVYKNIVKILNLNFNLVFG
jgi:abhydrolase domain-containing protein 13